MSPTHLALATATSVAIGLLTLATAAAAEPSATIRSLTLDYRAAADSCPGADRLADEVSAKLGYVPWSSEGKDSLRIRITVDGREFVATLELPDASSRVIRDSTCPGVVASLVTAVSVAIDREALGGLRGDSVSFGVGGIGRPSAKTQTRKRATGKPTVYVRATRPGVMVSVITQKTAWVGSGGGTASGASYKDLCVAPCSFELDPGFQDIVVRGGGGPSVGRQVELRPGQDAFLIARPGSSGRLIGGIALTSVSLTSFLTTGILALVGVNRSVMVPLTLVGAAGTVGGIWLTRDAHSVLEEEAAPLGQGTPMVSTAFAF